MKSGLILLFVSILGLILAVKLFKYILLFFLIVFVYALIKTFFFSGKKQDVSYHQGEQIRDVEARVLDEKSENKEKH